MIYAKNESACEQINGSHLSFDTNLGERGWKRKGRAAAAASLDSSESLFPFYASSIIVVGHLADVETLTPSLTAAVDFMNGIHTFWQQFKKKSKPSTSTVNLLQCQASDYIQKHFYGRPHKNFMKSSAAQKTFQEVWM